MEKGSKRTLAGVSIGHAVHDTWYGVAPIMLAVLSTEIGLKNSDIGLVLLIYAAVSAATQPLFGRLSERIGGRPLAVGSIIWTSAMFTAALLAHNKLVLMGCIGMAGFGSGAWHPQAAANATIAGGKRYGATAASIFFFGGALGTAFLGSALGGFLIDRFGYRSLLALTVLTVVLALTVVRAMVPRRLEVESKHEDSPRVRPKLSRQFWMLMGVLLIGIALRSFTASTLNSFLPKYEQDLGTSTMTYAIVVALYQAAIAVGGVIGSYMADRLGLQRVLAASIVLTSLALTGFLGLSGWWSYVSVVTAGFLLGPSHTLFMVAGQRQFPRRMAMVSGIFLGFTFVSGAVGTWLLGVLADTRGLGTMLRVLPVGLLLSAVCALVSVPKTAPARAESKDSLPA